MKIIETSTAPNPRRVRIFLAEKGLSIPLEHRDLDTLKSADFTQHNPMQRVPILVLDDGTTISETIAICRYFEELYPEPALFGRGPLGRASVEMWNRRMELNLFLAVTNVFRHSHPKMAAFEVPQVAEWAEANRPRVAQALQVLDAQLGRTRFIAGDDYSVADITALVAVDFMKPARLAVAGDLLNVARWRAEVSSRPSATA